jgi:predicted Zn-dependent protease
MIKKVLSVGTVILMVSTIACQQEESLVSTEISQSTLDKISALGLNVQDVQRIDDGYLVEGDIILHEDDLLRTYSKKHLSIAEVEQYRTFNLVTNLPRTITVAVSGTVSSAFSTAVDNAIARYNAENLLLTLQRVSSNANITIKIVNTGQYIASAGFPDSNGNPYPEVKYAKKYTSYSDGFMTTVLAHEIGHCIGFRHTDYMNRSYSCGSGGNEGQETTGVGAVHIPGTPTGPDADSWMLACLSSTTNRPFNANDKIALGYLY